MKKLFFLFLLSFLLLSNRSNAQASLGISQYDYVIANDTVAAYSTSDSIGFYVINRGSTVFNDIFRVYMAVQDSIGSSFHNVDTAYYVFPALINPGDSIPFSIHPYYITNDTNQYHYDINVIVACTSGHTVIRFCLKYFKVIRIKIITAV